MRSETTPKLDDTYLRIWKQVERYRHGQRPARDNLVDPLDLKRTLVSFKHASA